MREERERWTERLEKRSACDWCAGFYVRARRMKKLVMALVGRYREDC